jgi:NADH-ubiquinone oxidoreductase chain 3
MLFIFVPILAFILLALNILFSPHKPDESKVSAYECGFSPVYGQTRSTFQIHFYIVAMLFLIFDLEILLLFPIAVTLYQVSIFGFSIAIIFFIVLTIGFVLEIGSGAIALTNYDQSNSNNNNKIKILSLFFLIKQKKDILIVKFIKNIKFVFSLSSLLYNLFYSI